MSRSSVGLLLGCLLTVGCSRAGMPEPSTQEAPAPRVTVNGRVAVFLDLSEQAGAGRGSRSQAVFIRSMAQQHPEVPFLVVDVSSLSPQARGNRVMDWSLEGLSVAALSQVDDLDKKPAAILVERRSEDGEILWSRTGFVSAAELDQLLGYLPAAPGLTPR